ncbi:unnamed protein product [Prunus armeniaca]
MPHVFRGHLNRVVLGMRLRLTNGLLRPTRIAARVDLVSPRPARIAARVDLVSSRPAKMELTVLMELTDQEWEYA